MTKRSGKLNAHATHTGCSADLSHDHKGAEFLGPSTQNEAQTRAREANDISCHLFIDFFFFTSGRACCAKYFCPWIRTDKNCAINDKSRFLFSSQGQNRLKKNSKTCGQLLWSYPLSFKGSPHTHNLLSSTAADHHCLSHRPTETQILNLHAAFYPACVINLSSSTTTYFDK